MTATAPPADVRASAAGQPGDDLPAHAPVDLDPTGTGDRPAGVEAVVGRVMVSLAALTAAAVAAALVWLVSAAATVPRPVAVAAGLPSAAAAYVVVRLAVTFASVGLGLLRGTEELPA